ncbi:hypothetical protein [Rhizobium sp. NZLR4b]|uniref:hypothetical protein n=1 Tax=Rhizobium sp. NZLR4b TaxID=2731102 RepID=UPI001C82A369|nr:hypothetical protein [Rhizobium sp. NZLR4b]MBX5164760.1 hypothetical protein [Rhizobium sp. NZLR4b]
MKPIRAANDILIDYTKTLEFLVGPMIGEGCQVVLDEHQWPILLRFLDKIETLGDVNFVLEQCIDFRPGHSVAWDNDGTPEQDREVDRLVAELVKALGFSSVIPSGYVSDADDILTDGDPDPTPEATRISIQRYTHVHGCSPEWIARQLKLDLEYVVQEIQASSRRDDS